MEPLVAVGPRVRGDLSPAIPPDGDVPPEQRVTFIQMACAMVSRLMLRHAGDRPPAPDVPGSMEPLVAVGPRVRGDLSPAIPPGGEAPHVSDEQGDGEVSREAQVERRMLEAIKHAARGPEAKAAELIKLARINPHDGRKALRRLEAKGQYGGFLRPRPQRLGG
jgi:hypothetical protein